MVQILGEVPVAGKRKRKRIKYSRHDFVKGTKTKRLRLSSLLDQKRREEKRREEKRSNSTVLY